MLDKCRYEVSVIVLTKYEATGRQMKKEEVKKLDKSLMGQCLAYYKVMI